MWQPPINFFTLHYAYIILVGLVGFIIILPYGNLAVVDAYFFGTSASTESGLNTYNVKDLKTYQQLVIYFVPTLTHMAVINIIVISVRLYWFERRLKQVAPSLLRSERLLAPTNRPNDALTTDFLPQLPDQRDHASPPCALETASDRTDRLDKDSLGRGHSASSSSSQDRTFYAREPRDDDLSGRAHKQSHLAQTEEEVIPDQRPRITFAPVLHHPRTDSTNIPIPVPGEHDRGQRGYEIDGEDQEDTGKPITTATGRTGRESRWRNRDLLSLEKVASVERAASTIFVLGQTRSRSRSRSRSRNRSRSREPSQGRRATSPSAALHSRLPDLPQLSSQVTIGRNSQFHGLSAEERELLGGIEYRSLKLLLWICIGYFISLHVLGVVCLVPWIQHAPSKYTDYLDEVGQNRIWWAFYSAQTMANNLGFTLTPDSMVQFRDATFPMIVMTFLAYAGYNFYPILLRLIIWTMYKLILFGILFALNFVDVLLLITLDLNNPSVTELRLGPRILAAIFQAASSRHAGTSTFNLADLNPAAQFSLLVMMYISVYPIALTIRASNTNEERSLGIYAPEQVDPDDEKTSRKYVISHIRNQLSFDLWYIFFGIFLICIAESDKIMDASQPEFAVFPIFFEVTSAYANVGLSLGHPDVATSFSGQFSVFSKLVICAMMIRGRHRGLPYEIDRAIQLPSDRLVDDTDEPRLSRRPLLFPEGNRAAQQEDAQPAS